MYTKDLDKFLGVMFGGACGDALGVASEFLSPGRFPYLRDFQPRGKFRSKAGDYTDDTAQALCLAQSLLDCQGFDIEDQLDKYLMWLEQGYMSSQKRAFGIGRQSADRIYKYAQYKSGKLAHKPREEDLSGQKKDSNGSLMKIGAIPLYYAADPALAVAYAKEACKAMHNTDICLSASEYFVGLIIGALQGIPKKELQRWDFSPLADYFTHHPLHPSIQHITQGSYKRNPPLGSQYGYVVDSLEVALWGFFEFESFEEGMLAIVNLGNDADTNACIYGYLAGAYYGYQAIPSRWKDNLTNRDLIQTLTERLYHEGLPIPHSN